MTQLNILEQAKAGDKTAIETILNHVLRPHNVTVKVGKKNHCLYVVLAGSTIPAKQELIQIIRQQLFSLSIASLGLVKIYGAVWGQQEQAWYEQFHLHSAPEKTQQNTDQDNSQNISNQTSNQTNNLDTNYRNSPAINNLESDSDSNNSEKLLFSHSINSNNGNSPNPPLTDANSNFHPAPHLKTESEDRNNLRISLQQSAKAANSPFSSPNYSQNDSRNDSAQDPAQDTYVQDAYNDKPELQNPSPPNHSFQFDSTEDMDLIGSVWDDDIELEKLERTVQIGSHLLKLDSPQGLRIETLTNPPEFQFNPRSIPTLFSPPNFPYFVGRVEEFNQGIRELQAGKSVEFYSPSGWGKSSIIEHLSHCVNSSGIGNEIDKEGDLAIACDGILSFQFRHQRVEDILQGIFNGFYETPSDYKPLPQELTTALANKQALIIIDGNRWDIADIKYLQQSLPKCKFLFSSLQGHQLENTTSIKLPALSLSDTRTLATQELQRSLHADEITVLKLSDSPDNNPPENNPDHTSPNSPNIPHLHPLITNSPWLFKVATWYIKTTNQSFVQLQEQLPATNPDTALIELVLVQLTPSELRILEILAAMAGVALLAPQLKELSNITEIKSPLQRLVASHLVVIESDRYRIPDALVDAIAHIYNHNPADKERLTSLRLHTLKYFGNWVKKYRSLPNFVITEVDAIMEMLAWGVRNQQWQEVLNLSLAAEPSLIVTKLWGLWHQVLVYTFQSAQHLNDKAVLAWALHQQGTRALCLQEYTQARKNLEQALQLRQQLGDTQGIALTRANLLQIPTDQSPTPSPDQLSPQPSPKPGNSSNPYLSLRAWLLRFTFVGASAFIAYYAWSSLTKLETSLEQGNNKSTNVAKNLAQTPVPTLEKPKISLSQTNINFGAIAIDGEQAKKNLTITNHSSVSVRIADLEEIGKNSDFNLNLGACSSIIAPQERCRIGITFAPLSQGQHKGRITITDNKNQPIQTVSLIGIANKPAPPPEFSSPLPLIINIDEPLPLPANKKISQPKLQIPQPQKPTRRDRFKVIPITPPSSDATPTPTPIITPEIPNNETNPTPESTPVPETPTPSLPPTQTISPETSPSPTFSSQWWNSPSGGNPQ